MKYSALFGKWYNEYEKMKILIILNFLLFLKFLKNINLPRIKFIII